MSRKTARSKCSFVSVKYATKSCHDHFVYDYQPRNGSMRRSAVHNRPHTAVYTGRRRRARNCGMIRCAQCNRMRVRGYYELWRGQRYVASALSPRKNGIIRDMLGYFSACRAVTCSQTRRTAQRAVASAAAAAAERCDCVSRINWQQQRLAADVGTSTILCWYRNWCGGGQ